MLSFLIRVLIILTALWLIRRWIASLFAGSKQAGGEGSGSGARTNLTSDTVKDPVCGMYMDPRLALRIDNRNGSFYFCSDECRKKFLSV